MKNVLVLLSGGLDSNLALAKTIADPNVERVAALSFDYGQSNVDELVSAQKLCGLWGVPHTVSQVSIDNPDPRGEVPARNLVFVSHGCSAALAQGFNTVSIGAEPDSTYTDSSHQFLSAAAEVCKLFGVELDAPVKGLTNKRELLTNALDLGVPLGLCHSSLTNDVDGNCKTSKRFFDAITATLLRNDTNLTPVTLLNELGCLRTSFSDNPLPTASVSYNVEDHDTTATFKWAAALFTIGSSPLFGDKGPACFNVASTGSWARDLRAAVRKYCTKHKPQITYDHATCVSDMLGQLCNTDSKQAQWGIKQALAHLPRPRYCKEIGCRVVQGHLKAALVSLGYKVVSPAESQGLVLET